MLNVIHATLTGGKMSKAGAEQNPAQGSGDAPDPGQSRVPEPSSEDATARRADQPSSMMLLQTILGSALDPGYRKAAESAKHPLSWWRVALIAILVILLGFGTGVAIRSLRAQETGALAARNSLLEQVAEKQANTAILQEEISGLSTTAEQLSAASAPLAKVPAALSLSSANRSVYGPGVIVQISDADATVRDSEVRALTNALWVSGAEAISIDGVRLGPSTTIRTAGSTILVDFEAVSSPYKIEAIGNQQTMLETLMKVADPDQSSGSINRAGLSLTVEPADDLELNAATQSRFKYSEAVEGRGTE